MNRPILLAACCAALPSLLAPPVFADDAEQARSITVSLGEGGLQMASPEGWIPREPRFRGIVDFEFSVPPVEGDEEPGRVTIGGLSGGNEANIRRWFSMFQQPDGGNTAEAARREKKEVAGADIEFIHISGTYINPPFSGGGTYPNYRMIAAVIDAGRLGNYYVRLYGPARTVHGNRRAFEEMVMSLRQR